MPAVATSLKGYANIHKVQMSQGRCSVALLLQVIAQVGDRGEGAGCLDIIWVVGDEECLGSLVDDNALLALLLSVF